jgi:hypothetical protein
LLEKGPGDALRAWAEKKDFLSSRNAVLQNP